MSAAGDRSAIFSTYGQACAVNFDWPWCPRARNERTPDLRIELGSLGRFSHYGPGDYSPYRTRPARASSGPPVVTVDRGLDGHYRVTYADGTEFVIDAQAGEIFGRAGGGLTLEDLIVYLQGPILGFVLRLRGLACLHASAAVVEGRAIAVVGQSGAGKSTSAAAFARLGLPVLTDDVLALRDGQSGFEAQPGLPRVLLWPDSVASLFGDSEALPRIVSTWDKRYLDLARSPYQFAEHAVPLGAVYVFGERLSETAEPMFEDLRGSKALMCILANTYANDLLDELGRARELELVGRLLDQVPIRLLRAPAGAANVERVCEAVIADSRRSS